MFQSLPLMRRGILTTSLNYCFYATILTVITAIHCSAFPTPQSSLHLDFGGSACKRLITNDFTKDQIVHLIANIFTSEDEVKMIGYLRGGDAQTFIDVLDEVRL